MRDKDRERDYRMSLRLDDEELYLRDALARRHGIDASGVMRQALRRWAREEQIEPPPSPPAPPSRRR